MGQHTAIQWCDSTENGEMGCKGCELWDPDRGIRHCYAGNMTVRLAGTKGYPESFDKPQLFPGRIEKACRWKDLRGTCRKDKPWLDRYPRVIFLDNMGDTFTEGLSVDWMLPLVPLMGASPHVWIILTKRPGRMLEFVKLCRKEGGLPTNFWLCTTLTGPASLGRVPHLLKIRDELPGHVLGLSVEPLLADLTPLLRERFPDLPRLLSWVKIGGESTQAPAPARLCSLAWLRGVRDFFRPHAAVFVKQLGSHVREREGTRRINHKDSHGGDWDEWPKDLRVREMPQPVECQGGGRHALALVP
jgi:protein gp37